MDINEIIKEAAEQIPIPASLAPEQMEKKLRSAGKRVNYHRRAWATAACLFAVAFAGIISFRFFPSPTGSENTTEDSFSATGASLSGSTTYKEVCKKINAFNKVTEYEYVKNDGLIPESARQKETQKSAASYDESSGVGDDDIALGSNAADSASDYSDTDTQVDGVMEGDIVKTDGHRLFTIRDGAVGFFLTIYQADGADVKEQKKLHIDGGSCREMYIENNRLALICSLEEETVIYLYDISNPASPKELGCQKQDGYFCTSRLSGGYLYTFTNYVVYQEKCTPDKPEEFVPKLNGRVMEETHLMMMDKQKENSYMVMTSLSLENGSGFTDSLAALGGSDVYYMSSENIYMVKADFGETYSDCNSIVHKYRYKDGTFTSVAGTKIHGQISDSYYMHEYQGNFIFVYTRYKNGTTTNGLGILDGNLKLQGELSGLGDTETIYSSYYIDNMAYFVTYRNTDPVFAVDISDPKKPKLLSELKLPGFSSYLHSFGEHMLLGIGEGEKNNVKLSLFSIKNNKAVKELTKKELASFTYSIAGENHRAVFVDEQRGLIGLTVGDMNTAGEENKYRVYEYKNGKIRQVLSHKTGSIEDVRGVRIGEYFYLVDVEKGVEVFDIKTWKQLS